MWIYERELVDIFLFDLIFPPESRKPSHWGTWQYCEAFDKNLSVTQMLETFDSVGKMKWSEFWWSVTLKFPDIMIYCKVAQLDRADSRAELVVGSKPTLAAKHA